MRSTMLAQLLIEVLMLLSLCQTATAIDNGLGLKPPMGWVSLQYDEFASVLTYAAQLVVYVRKCEPGKDGDVSCPSHTE